MRLTVLEYNNEAGVDEAGVDEAGVDEAGANLLGRELGLNRELGCATCGNTVVVP